jgi:hypothetical protein
MSIPVLFLNQSDRINGLQPVKYENYSTDRPLNFVQLSAVVQVLLLPPPPPPPPPLPPPGLLTLLNKYKYLNKI